MPSLTDIPKSLLYCDEKPDFLRWLKQLPTDDMTKKEILFLWAEYTHCPITPIDMMFIFGEDYKERGI